MLSSQEILSVGPPIPLMIDLTLKSRGSFEVRPFSGSFYLSLFLLGDFRRRTRKKKCFFRKFWSIVCFVLFLAGWTYVEGFDKNRYQSCTGWHVFMKTRHCYKGGSEVYHSHSWNALIEPLEARIIKKLRFGSTLIWSKE
ncbi:hypothetical protein RB195_008384 [Necator americanus]|uniref:Uncharacterized protein n=1 Tax=Necator americanus TaxID=51031 RepID=A0ABR1CRR3_NECAM